MRKKDWKRARKRTGSGRPASTRQIGELLKRTRNRSATLAFIVVSVDNRAFRLVDRHKGVAVPLAGCPDPYLDRNRGTKERGRERERRKTLWLFAIERSFSLFSRPFLVFHHRKPRKSTTRSSSLVSTLNEKFSCWTERDFELKYNITSV